VKHRKRRFKSRNLIKYQRYR